MPKFSIIIPVYNAAKYLRECIDSVLAQTYTDFEVICVDDGSTDGSGEILDEYARRSTPPTCTFQVIHQRNGGEGAARNKGLSLAHGEIIVWVDADDLMDAGALAEVAAILTREDADMVRLRYKGFTGDAGKRVAEQRHETEAICGRGTVQRWALQTLTGAGYCWITFIKREKFIHEFPVGIQYAGDSLFMLSNACSFDKVIQSEYVGYYYRDTPTSVMKKPFPSAERVRFFTAFQTLVKGYGVYDAKLSWMGWFHLVNWCVRSKDLTEKKAIHRIFCDLVRSGSIRCKDIASYARLAFAVYVAIGWRWPITLTYRIITMAVCLRDRCRGFCEN